ncbi:ParB N-terminal domain-containing protein [Halostella sp. JP-L12]|uniref:ParB/RepB/Spo0J family partition protein n=1 Tax=Halostella TaxID=1843185 RepID=UPI000EF7FDE5|nr:MULTISPECIES: ParB N-terminal domain-containing protein [Halostella]NHN48399.1 ParB N-terminal domain-containing protein [Halostella sp. JP-L12]
MDFALVDPNELTIDEQNERRSDIGADPDSNDSLRESIRELGVTEVIKARQDGNGELKVYAGQRRTLAAQAEQIDKVPVLIKDLDDEDALIESIVENTTQLKKEVSREDRAKAIQWLVEQQGGKKEVADATGLSPGTVRNWLEPYRDEWKNTIFHPEYEGEREVDPEQLSDELLRTIRKVTEGERAEEFAIRIIEEKIPTKAVKQAASRASNADEFDEKLDEMQEKVTKSRDHVQERVYLVGDDAEAVKKYAKTRGVTEREAIEHLTKEKLEEEGYY